MQQLHEQLVVRPQLHPADAGVITSLIPTLSRGSDQETKNSFLVGLWWTSPPLDGSHCLCFPPEGSSFPGPTFYSLSSAEAWTALIQLLRRTLESCTGAPTLWKWGYPLCLWGSHSGRQNRTGRAVSEVMARTELVFFVSFNKEQFPTLLILPTLSKMSGMLKINNNPCERETDTKEHWFHHTQFSFLPLSIADSVLCFGKTPPEFFLPFSAQIFGNFCFTKHKRGGRGDLVDAVSCIQNKAEPWAVSWAEE